MVELRLTAKALDELAEIDEYGAVHYGQDVADSYAQGMRQAFDLLERHPQSAPARSDYGIGIRCCAYGAHLILHTFEEEIVLVVRILHHARDVRRALEP